VKKIFKSWQEVDAYCMQLALTILKSDWRPDYIVGLTRGGLTPGVLLSHLLAVPMHTLKVQLRDGDQDTEMNCWMPEDVVDGKNILIVDDINDTGETLAWIRSDWSKSVFQGDMDYHWHKRVRVAVLVNNLASKESVDFCIDEINKVDDPSWICFPWEQD
jgi:hypoxanthine phosphoribosyltransferase